MLKVILIDDDKNVREFIKKIIDWEKEGFKICGESVNGKKGLQLAMEQLPDIIILDLEMPVMDGVEMLRLLGENNVSSKVIVLSCHNEFSYVKDAMKLGAFDYILKHKMKQDEFLQMVINIRETILSEKANLKEILASSGSESFLKLEKHETMDAIKERRLLDILKGLNNSPQHIKETLEELCTDEDNYILISIEWDYFHKKAGLLNDIDLDGILVGTQKIINNSFQAAGNFLSGRVDDGLFVVLMAVPRSMTNFEVRKFLYIVLSQIQNDLLSTFNQTVSVGISNVCSDYTEISNSWRQSKMALTNKFYKGINNILFFNEVFYSDNIPQIDFKIAEFKSVINSTENALRVLDELFEEILSKLVDPKSILKIFHRLVFILTGYMEKLGIDLNEIFYTHNFLYIVQKESETLQDYKEWLIDLYNRVNNIYFNTRKNKYCKEIITALDYINANYAKEITLEDVSDYVCISRNYFSQLFKKETGENFINYLIKLRLEKAKELLLQQDLKIYSIAYATGFQSHSYFNNVFKEYEGQTPNHYRNSHTKR